MQVKYLIELLQKENPEAEVRLHGFDHNDGGEDIIFVCSLGVDGTVKIEGKFDVDLDYQIVSRYKTAREEKQSLDVLHKDLYNHSITVAEVEEAMGIDSACEYKKYLEENKNDKT